MNAEVFMHDHVREMRAKGWKLSGRLLPNGDLEYVRLH